MITANYYRATNWWIVGEGNYISQIVHIQFLMSGLVHISLSCFGEQRWRSGESARLPPLCPRFDSRTWRHMWVEFVVRWFSSLLREVFLRVWFSPLLKHQHFQTPFLAWKVSQISALNTLTVKDVLTRIFYSIDFFLNFYDLLVMT